MEVITPTDLLGLHDLLSMKRSQKPEKLSNSRPILQKTIGRIRPLNPGNIHNLGDSRPDDRIELVVISLALHKLIAIYG
jgi:hypothetical protein